MADNWIIVITERIAMHKFLFADAKALLRLLFLSVRPG